MEMPVRACSVHFFPERHDLFARNERVGIAVADENPCGDCPLICRGSCVEQPVKACDHRQIGSVPSQFEDGLSAHAETDRTLA